MKKLLVLLLVAALLVSGLAFAEPGITKDKVLIGTFQALSGPVAYIGLSMRKGMDAYFNWVNANGGVYGRKIELLVADDQFNPAKTVVEVKRMVEQDKVFSIVGGLGTPGCLAVMKYLNDSKVPFVYQGSGALGLAVPPNKYIFSVQPNYYSVEGPIVAKYLARNLGYKRIGMVYRAADDGKEELAGFQSWLVSNRLEKLLVKAIPVNPNATSFDNEILELLGAGVDVVFLSMYGQQPPNFMIQAKQYGLDAKIVMSYPNSDIQVIQLSQGAAEGAQAMAWVWLGDADSEQFQRYLAIYQETFPQEIPNAYAAAGFIAGEVFTEGLRRAGQNPTREGLVQALETMSGWQGLISPIISYKPYSVGDNTCRVGLQAMYAMEVVNGLWEKVSDWIDSK
ncbi:MAG TPA: ABC transporter substrate-binding protein [Thermotogota bacterium]|jgi:branched-chain amino acid transport system substrate-binding protein|nr:ABC transporter substrate-binding protein [Thermotogota bacterium]NLH19744.1 ABC transporter substrate-binding protein [Thermotogaceae bacterium]OQC31832.1 MAG: Leucine-, isoleucine-, valine-, threonine-, and alanine-binding protein precursor [Thermotogota bacterium ADurb.Bin062]HNW47183.1 ABC transporter substrate-binding protein [Thermotogota bacterium]HNY81986.1 ABC transporter substrate-binding protein [Thermotogota bacterium]